MALSLRQKNLLDMRDRVSLFKRTLKQWINYVGVKFMQVRDFTEEQEDLLAEMTEFYLDYIDKVEQDHAFLKRVQLDPIKLPEKKKGKLNTSI